MCALFQTWKPPTTIVVVVASFISVVVVGDVETVEKRMGRLQHTKKAFGKPMEKNLLFQRLSTVPFPFAVMEQRMKIPFRA